MRDKVIPVLAQHHAVVSANVVTGFVDRKSHRVLSPWNQKFTDDYGVEQDYGSTQRGLKAAVEAGVLEIQSHGWTHMQPIWILRQARGGPPIWMARHPSVAGTRSLKTRGAGSKLRRLPSCFI